VAARQLCKWIMWDHTLHIRYKYTLHTLNVAARQLRKWIMWDHTLQIRYRYTLHTLNVAARQLRKWIMRAGKKEEDYLKKQGNMGEVSRGGW